MHAADQFAQTYLFSLHLLLQQCLLCAGVEQGLGAVVAVFAGGVERLFALIGSLQAQVEPGQGLGRALPGSNKGFFILPGVDRKRRIFWQAGE